MIQSLFKNRLYLYQEKVQNADTWFLTVQTFPSGVHPDTIPVQTSNEVTALSNVMTIVQAETVAGTTKFSCPSCPVDHVAPRVVMVSQVAASETCGQFDLHNNYMM
jgi:hypothetical protein